MRVSRYGVLIVPGLHANSAGYLAAFDVGDCVENVVGYGDIGVSHTDPCE
jgi:hypothetical protein